MSKRTEMSTAALSTKVMKLGRLLSFCWWWCRSVAQSCPVLCDPMDCSTPGFPVPHRLPESAQVHVHCIGDAIQLSHPLSPSSSAFNLSQHQSLFQWIGSSPQVSNVLGHIISSFFPWWVTSHIPSGMLVKKKKCISVHIFFIHFIDMKDTCHPIFT